MLPNIRILLLLVALVPFTAGAVEVAGLYRTEVPVADQTAQSRVEAIGLALQQVMVKASGSGAVNEGGDSPAAAEAARFVQQYQYRRANAATTEGLMLHVQFNEAAVKRLLRERGQPVWGTARPLTLVWLAVEQGGERQLVGANDAGVAREVLLQAGELRGLPVRLPLLDLADRSRVQPADIWGDFHQPILDVSKRYEPQAILVGRLYPRSGGQWEVRWSLYSGPLNHRWQVGGSDPRALIASGVEGAADRLSLAFAQTPAGGNDTLVLDVSDVFDLAGYRRVMDYLQGLDGIEHVSLTHVATQGVRFQLKAAGGAASVVNTLALGDTLVPLEWQPDQSTQGLLYRLVP